MPEKAAPSRIARQGCKDTMIYTHVLQRGGLAVRSPVDGDALLRINH
jgi:hypothetical protein